MNPNPSNSKERRVVITGIGAVTPLGLNARDTWKGLKAGRSGIDRITIFDSSEFPVKIAGEVKNFDFGALVKQDPSLNNAGRSTCFALRAAEEAYKDARIRPFRINSDRFAIYFGAGDSGNDFPAFAETVNSAMINERDVDGHLFYDNVPQRMNLLHELETQPYMTVAHLARRFDIRGPVSNCLTACAASSQAIGEASEWIRRGDADVVLTGGSHSMVYPLGVAGFSLLTVLSNQNANPQKASRPFDKNRDGFVLAEGAGALILEELEHAKKRRAPIYGELVGYGSTCDAYRLTDMDPEGKGASRAMEMALQKANLTAQNVNYINAHGTATAVNDSIETRVIKNVFGDLAYKIPVSSIKSMLGHMIAAAGVVELMTCLMSIREKVVPPTMNFETRDPECDLDYVPNEARPADVNIAMSNSFGFGGQNICLLVRGYDE